MWNFNEPIKAGLIWGGCDSKKISDIAQTISRDFAKQLSNYLNECLNSLQEEGSDFVDQTLSSPQQNYYQSVVKDCFGGQTPTDLSIIGQHPYPIYNPPPPTESGPTTGNQGFGFLGMALGMGHGGLYPGMGLFGPLNGIPNSGSGAGSGSKDSAE
jgi:hypothetical protein